MAFYMRDGDQVQVVGVLGENHRVREAASAVAAGAVPPRPMPPGHGLDLCDQAADFLIKAVAEASGLVGVILDGGQKFRLGVGVEDRVFSPAGEHAAGAGEDLRGGHALHAAAVQVVAAGFHGIGPSLLDRRGEARRPKLGVQALGDLLTGLEGQLTDFDLNLFNGGHAHGANGAGSSVAGNCPDGWLRLAAGCRAN
jgi:hypothetical protein